MKKPKKITEKILDTAYSKYIRNRDSVCQYPLRWPDDYHAGYLQNSHFHGRSARSTRYDDENCDAMCGRHHQFLEGRKEAEYKWWKEKQLGKVRLKALEQRYVKMRPRPPTEIEKREMIELWKTPIANRSIN